MSDFDYQKFTDDLYDFLDTYDLTITSANFCRRESSKYTPTGVVVTPMAYVYFDLNGDLVVMDPNLKEIYQPTEIE
jgi:hypothetical protein